MWPIFVFLLLLFTGGVILVACVISFCAYCALHSARKTIKELRTIHYEFVPTTSARERVRAVFERRQEKWQGSDALDSINDEMNQPEARDAVVLIDCDPTTPTVINFKSNRDARDNAIFN